MQVKTAGLQIRIDGLEQVKGKLRAIKELRRPVYVFLRDAGKLTRDIERANIPKLTGRTAMGVFYSVSTGGRGLWAKVEIRGRGKRGTKKKETREQIGRFIEKGTKPHTIGALTKKAVDIGGEHPFARVKHPGQPARPFIQRTADQARGRVQALLGPLSDAIKALWRS